MGDPIHGPSRTKGLLFVGVVFFLGMICGAALFFLGQLSVGPPGPPGPPPPHPLERLTRELDLDPDQQREIRAMLDEQRVRLDTVLEDFRRSIRDVLRSDQRERFDNLRPPRAPAPPPPQRGHPPPPPPAPRPEQ
ncbi:MAG: periplasmic heavy metal sensor [Acidobacteriota bacterium]|nr:MAG: periplasmic heavy metal sensor [Acidobacteriota bacterium]